MKLSTGQYKAIIAVVGVIILALLAIQFEFDDLMRASLTDESDIESSWVVNDVDYSRTVDDKNTVLLSITFNNNKPVYDQWKEEEAICEVFDFKLYPEGFHGVQSENDVEIDYNDYHSMTFPFRDIPDGTVGFVEVKTYGTDENGSHYEMQEVLIVPIEIPAEAEKTPGFEAVFAIAGLLAVIYLIKKE